MASGNANTAAQDASNYGAFGQGLAGNLAPRLEQQATNPQGYGASGLATMETANLAGSAATSGAAQQEAKLRAMRTGNAAGLPAEQAAIAGETARASGSGLQDILSKNAMLKEQQRLEANKDLMGLAGQETTAGLDYSKLVPEDINAALNAEQTGWLQNVEGGLGTLAKFLPGKYTRG
jgi:hypothetical protein